MAVTATTTTIAIVEPHTWQPWFTVSSSFSLSNCLCTIVFSICSKAFSIEGKWKVKMQQKSSNCIFDLTLPTCERGTNHVMLRKWQENNGKRLISLNSNWCRLWNDRAPAAAAAAIASSNWTSNFNLFYMPCFYLLILHLSKSCYSFHWPPIWCCASF